MDDLDKLRQDRDEWKLIAEQNAEFVRILMAERSMFSETISTIQELRKATPATISNPVIVDADKYSDELKKRKQQVARLRERIKEMKRKLLLCELKIDELRRPPISPQSFPKAHRKDNSDS